MIMKKPPAVMPYSAATPVLTHVHFLADFLSKPSLLGCLSPERQSAVLSHCSNIFGGIGSFSLTSKNNNPEIKERCEGEMIGTSEEKKTAMADVFLCFQATLCISQRQ